jgi:hypothetical protein
LLASLSPWDLKMLLVFYSREGFTVERFEVAVAQLSSIQFNKLVKKKADQRKPSDFMPYHDTWGAYLREKDEVLDDLHTLRKEFGKLVVVRGTRKSN